MPLVLPLVAPCAAGGGARGALRFRLVQPDRPAGVSEKTARRKTSCARNPTGIFTAAPEPRARAGRRECEDRRFEDRRQPVAHAGGNTVATGFSRAVHGTIAGGWTRAASRQIIAAAFAGDHALARQH